MLKPAKNKKDAGTSTPLDIHPYPISYAKEIPPRVVNIQNQR